ncbi:MAG: L-seryl-tRNA(Sec) selenium transferase, partial [Planctomycetes bacterium]|nr:L-seryl-tRNA(Sec) selenium transferase [Planctomycetota bacterium]
MAQSSGACRNRQTRRPIRGACSSVNNDVGGNPGTPASATSAAVVAAELRDIPPVDRLLQQLEPEFADTSRALLRAALRQQTEALRASVRRSPPPAGTVRKRFVDGSFKAELAATLIDLLTPRHDRVINATGVLLHTGLGRAPLCDAARAALERIARYGLVEIDPATGERGRRELFVRDLLCELTGAEEATVVNNNAAAVLLLLRGLAHGKECVVSRGELVEIGGGFRVPEVMSQSGARLREVGTTNRTRIADYAAASGPETGLLMHIHTSNFRVVGFTEMPSLAELVALGREKGLPTASDLGSGCLRPFPQLPFHDEPIVTEAVASGLDVVTFSGDKMLGGPQCGILVGRREPVLALRRHPLFRAIRPDKLTLAALEATLLEWRKAGDGELPLGLPFFAMMAAPPAALRERARRIVAAAGLAGGGSGAARCDARI